MQLSVNGILVDANCEGHLALLLQLFHEGWRRDVWEVLQLPPVTFAELGLQADASDRAVWAACQRVQVVLLTANRNDAGPASLETTTQQHNTTESLPKDICNYLKHSTFGYFDHTGCLRWHIGVLPCPVAKVRAASHINSGRPVLANMSL